MAVEIVLLFLLFFVCLFIVFVNGCSMFSYYYEYSLLLYCYIYWTNKHF